MCLISVSEHRLKKSMKRLKNEVPWEAESCKNKEQSKRVTLAGLLDTK